MKRRCRRIDSVDEEISVIPKVEIVQTKTRRVISGYVSPEQKVNILKFFYKLYDNEKHNIGTEYKSELHEIIGEILDERIPIETMSFGDIKNVLLKNFPFLDRSK